MPSALLSQTVDRRTLWLRVTLLSASFLGLIACAPVWLNTHTFPLLPIVPGFPILPAPWDKVLFGAMLLSLVAAVFVYRPAVRFFLVTSFFAYCEDQNRGQPWLYMYWVMLLLTLFPVSTALAACRWGMSIVYFWSGVQKFNASFFQTQPNWFTEPAAHWHLPPFVLDLLRWAVKCTPFIELGIGLALWSPRLRRWAIGAAVLLHLGALLFLGPLGHNYNWVVWPWNLAMPALIWVLFAKGNYWQKHKPEPAPAAATKTPAPKQAAKRSAAMPAPDGSWKQAFGELFRSKIALTIVALYSLLPILSYSGLWDSYFSFALYSDNSATANIFVTQTFRDNLPPKMQAQVKPFSQTFDPQHQGPFVFNYGAWGYEELHVPPIAEPRNFRHIFKHLQTWSKEPGDLRMIVGQRDGLVIFYEGESREFLTPK